MNFLKLFFTLQFIKLNKGKIFTILILLILILITIYLYNDMSKIVDESKKVDLFMTKWGIILSSVLTIFFLIYKSFSSTKEKIVKKTKITEIFKKNKNSKPKRPTKYSHKEHMLKDITFQTKGEAIKEKYKK
jgi:hypothetical protein